MIENMMNTARDALATTESLAMCDYPPISADAPENYHLDNGLRTVGQIVTAYCKNTTVAIVKCMPDLRWNATVPSCPFDETSRDNMSTVLIVLWVVGGLLFISLLILIAVIITFKSKSRCALERTRSPSDSVFHISGSGGGRGQRRGRGGDNPAFSRADEICGEWSYYRGEHFPDSQRLPSYHEAITNSCMTVPVRTRHASQRDPPAVRTSSSSSLTDPDRHFQSLGINLRLDSSNVSEAQNRSGREDSETNLEEQSAQRTQRRETSGPTSDARTEQAAPINHISSSSDPRNAQESGNSRRYAENYPRCFFEDEPPPPYTLQPTSYNPNRAAQQQQQPRVSGHHHSRTRSMLTFTSARAGRTQNEHFVQNQNYRRSMCDRLAGTANSRSENVAYRPQVHMLQSIPSSSNGQIYSLQNDIGYNTRSNVHSFRPSSNASNILSSTTNGTYPSAEMHTRHSRSSDEHMANHTLTANHIQTPISRLNMHPNVPQVSPVPESNTGNGQPGYALEILIGENRRRDILDYSRTRVPLTQDPMYVIRNCHATTSVLPYSTTNLSQQSHHSQTQPLGTSTPVTQSPIEARRFGPANHPSPLPIPRNHPFHRASQEQPTRHSYDSEVNRHSVVKVGRELSSSVPQSLPKDSHSFSSCFKHTDLGTAPLARFDTEYTYL